MSNPGGRAGTALATRAFVLCSIRKLCHLPQDQRVDAPPRREEAETRHFKPPCWIYRQDAPEDMIPYAEWKKTGFSKRALHHMKQNAKSGKPFTLNKHNSWNAGAYRNLIRMLSTMPIKNCCRAFRWLKTGLPFVNKHYIPVVYRGIPYGAGGRWIEETDPTHGDRVHMCCSAAGHALPGSTARKEVRCKDRQNKGRMSCRGGPCDLWKNEEYP